VANRGWLVDTGPLVAMLSRRDQHTAVCLAASKLVRPPFYTSWPTITEATHLQSKRPSAVENLLSQIRSGELLLLPLGAGDIDGMTRIFSDYEDQGLELADVALMHLASREGIERIFTTDHRHFSLYRTPKGRALSLQPVAL